MDNLSKGYIIFVRSDIIAPKPTRITRLAMRNLFENSPKVSAVAVGCSKNNYYFCPINTLLYSKYADDKTNYR